MTVPSFFNLKQMKYWLSVPVTRFHLKNQLFVVVFVKVGSPVPSTSTSARADVAAPRRTAVKATAAARHRARLNMRRSRDCIVCDVPDNSTHRRRASTHRE